MYKVLLIDDEEMALEYLQNLLDWEEYGFRIVGCATVPEEARRIFREELPEVVISDICMPEQSGLEFCQYILDIKRTTKIFLLSAFQEFEYARKAINMGVQDYILKYELTGELLGKKLTELGEVLRREQAEKGTLWESLVKKANRKVLSLCENKDRHSFGDEFLAEEHAAMLGAVYECLKKLEFQSAVWEIRKVFEEFENSADSFEQRMDICSALIKNLSEWQNLYFHFESAQMLPDWMKWGSMYSFADVEKECIRKIMDTERNLNDKNLAKYSYHVRTAVNYLKAHYMEDISVDDVADAIGVSGSYLGRMFKGETGFTVLGYLTEIRMAIARQLLAGRQYKVYEVGEKVGYKTSQYFSELFMKKTGMSPGAYRKKMRDQNEV